jgi:hypothetical protein
MPSATPGSQGHVETANCLCIGCTAATAATNSPSRGRQVSPRAVGGRMDCCPVSATGNGRRETFTQYRRQLDGARVGGCGLDTTRRSSNVTCDDGTCLPCPHLFATQQGCVGGRPTPVGSTILAEAHPDWRLVSHEQLCSDPTGQFHELFAAVGLQWTDAVKLHLARSNRNGTGLVTMRVAADQPERWRKRLTGDQSERDGRDAGKVPRVVSRLL